MYTVEVPCEDCRRGQHIRCDGEAWNDNFECVVDCACLVCLPGKQIPHVSHSA